VDPAILTQCFPVYGIQNSDMKCLISEELSDCGDMLDKLEAEATDVETESDEEEEEDIVLVEKKRVKSAFLDDEADVSDDEGSEEDESELEEDVACGESQGDDMREEISSQQDEADVLGDGIEEGKTSPADKQYFKGEGRENGTVLVHFLLTEF